MNERPNKNTRTTCVLLCVLSTLSVVGCSSTQKSNPPFASVIIVGNTPGQIRNAAVAVFGNDGYQVINSNPSSLVFEKKGTSFDNFAYGGWLGDEGVWIRVKGAIVPAGEMTFRLECSAYRVLDRNGSVEEENAVGRSGRKPYQKLLDKVAQRLNTKPPA